MKMKKRKTNAVVLFGVQHSVHIPAPGLAAQTGRTSSNVLKARSHRSAMSTNATNRRIMSIQIGRAHV